MRYPGPGPWYAGGIRMKKIYIWGAGFYLKIVYETIDKNSSVISGIIDTDRQKQGKQWIDGICIEAPDILLHSEFDYIIISVKKYQAIAEECIKMGIGREKVVPFWSLNEDMPCMDAGKRKIIELEEKITQLRREIRRCNKRMENQPYEFGLGRQIHIKPSEQLLSNILEKRASLCRFGDGEFEIMRGRERLWYQNMDRGLSARLKKVLDSEKDNILIAVADDFGSLEAYTEEAADGIRDYLSGGTRKEVLDLLDTQRTYYNAYVSRPYMMYRDKTYAERIFKLFKEIWRQRDVLIVEGQYTRTGAGNDLLADANSIRRIICPDTNAYDCYGEIWKAVRENSSDGALVLLSLGPAATILAFDLAGCGIQALDIGQLDNEYEWYLSGAAQRVEIKGKTVAELNGYHRPENTPEDLLYEGQIIAVVARK